MANEIHSVGRLLLVAAREFSAQVCAKLRENEHSELRSGHALLVANWDVEGTRISTLAERAEITKQAMGVWVKEMETLGYLERGADPLDARAILAVPTEKGRQLLVDVARLMAQLEAEQVEKIGRETLDQLQATLQKMLE